MQIKMNVLAAGLVAGSMLMGSAHAAYDMNFMNDMYLALDYTQAKLNQKTHSGVPYGLIYDGMHTSLVPTIGVKAHDMFNIEMSYFFSGAKERSVPSTVRHRVTNQALTQTSIAKLRTFAVDGVTHYPVMDDVCLIGSLGVTRDHLKGYGPHVVVKHKMDSYGVRLGWGAAYKVNDALSARALGRVAMSSLDSTNSTILSWSLGMTYAL